MKEGFCIDCAFKLYIQHIIRCHNLPDNNKIVVSFLTVCSILYDPINFEAWFIFPVSFLEYFKTNDTLLLQLPTCEEEHLWEEQMWHETVEGNEHQRNEVHAKSIKRFESKICDLTTTLNIKA